MAIKILFQGDSITDALRNYTNDSYLGQGYVTMTAGKLSFAHPGEYSFLNRGISGHRVVDLYARWKKDTLNHQPDIITILIGINDCWHELGDGCNGVEADRFEQVYDMMLAFTRQRLPETKIVILEPFVLRASATEENWEYFSREVPLRAQAAKRMAEKHGCRFVPLQADFDAACEKAPASHWLMDGVHPNLAGSELIAHKLAEAIEQL